MIPIQRTPEPNILRRHKLRWRNRYLAALAAYCATPSASSKRNKERAENKYHHPDIKQALNEMCGGKCAYCESHILHVDYGHIEHFQPKSRYPERCFDWENLLLGCAVCNGAEYKSDKCPLADAGGPLINPCHEDPQGFFAFEYDPATGTANVVPKNVRGTTTERELGLNRPELVKHRSAVVRKIAFVALRAKEGDADALSELQRCMANDQEYAAFARAFAQRFNLL